MTFQPSSRRPVRFPETKPLLIAVVATAFGAAATLAIVGSWPAAGSQQRSTGQAAAVQMTGAPAPFVEGLSIDLGGPVVRGLVDSDGPLAKPFAGESLGHRVVRGLLDTEGAVAIDSGNSLAAAGPAQRTYPVSRNGQRGHITTDSDFVQRTYPASREGQRGHITIE